jgi:hypothetical protein
VFAAPKAKHKQVVQGYAALVECGTDIAKLRRELRAPPLISAYFELVSLLAEEQCSLEVATARPTDGGLDVHELPRELARAQAAGLAEPHVETREREFIASVTAASLSSDTIELKLDDDEQLSGTVVAGVNKLTGLRIGAQYRFAIKQTTRTDTPSAAPKVEIEIRITEADFGQFEEAAPERPHPSAKHAKALTWSKPLSQTDALRAPSGSIRAFVPLTGSRTGIDYATWFRRELFGDLTWSRTETLGEEETAAQFEVKFLGVVIGSNTLNLSHQPSRMRHNREAPTRLHWNASMRHLLRQNNVTGQMLTLIRDKSGQLHLIVGPLT